MPGVTRDAVAVEANFADRPVLLVDTGGIGEGEAELDQQVYARSRREISRADVVMLLVDVQDFTGEDHELLAMVRESGRPAILVVNKVDNPERDQYVSEFYQYGIPNVVSISAAHGYGIDDLEDAVNELLPVVNPEPTDALESANIDIIEDETRDALPKDGVPEVVRLAILGQPNTGKSSLLNRLVGEDRAIVSELAGTTRDTVEARFRYKNTDFMVVDTAGIRRKSKVHESVEYYAVQRALDTIDASELVVLMIDVIKGLSDQDKKIAARVAERGRGVVVVLNKWDLLGGRSGQSAQRDHRSREFSVSGVPARSDTADFGAQRHRGGNASGPAGPYPRRTSPSYRHGAAQSGATALDGKNAPTVGEAAN